VGATAWSVIGIVASVVIAFLTYLFGGRAAARQHRESLRASHAENETLVGELRDLRNTFSSFVERTQGRLRANAAPVGRPSQITGDSDRSVANDPAIAELVIAWLGALVNERGEVDMTRLLAEVSRALGSAHLKDVIDELRRLHSTGALEWDGPDDVATVQTVRVKLALAKRGDGSEVAG
jgi:hypothetical protein